MQKRAMAGTAQMERNVQRRGKKKERELSPEFQNESDE